MKAKYFIWSFFVCFTVFSSQCKEPYTPPAVPIVTNYLVVNGFLNAGNDSSVITLGRTRSLGDSIPPVVESNAQVSVLGTSGEVFPFTNLSRGVYGIESMNLNSGEYYRLQVLTSDGKKYLSDSIIVTITPAIDSISWKQDTTSSENKLGVTIYANTHDPQNNTRYYRWEYIETWEYHSKFDSYDFYDGVNVVGRREDQHIYACWHNATSTNLILASSAKLSQDLIYQAPINFIPTGDAKMGVIYSILVKQYAMSRQAYEYWENLKRNTELTGSIFDPQPSQITGNIHCVTNPEEPVLGFISASSVQQQRIFIKNSSLEHWGYQTVPSDCPEVIIPPDSFAYFFGGLQSMIPTRQIPNSPKFYASRTPCVDCTVQGGSTNKPAFWPF